MFSGSRKSSITKLFAIIVSDKKPFRKNFYSRSLTGTKVHLQFKYKHVQADNLHNVKIVQIWSFFWFVFSRIQLNVLKTFRRLYLYTFHAVLNKRPAQRKRQRFKKRILDSNQFRKKAPSQTFDRSQNTPLKYANLFKTHVKPPQRWPCFQC